jgi:hypothetical protein
VILRQDVASGQERERLGTVVDRGRDRVVATAALQLEKPLASVVKGPHGR